MCILTQLSEGFSSISWLILTHILPNLVKVSHQSPDWYLHVFFFNLAIYTPNWYSHVFFPNLVKILLTQLILTHILPQLSEGFSSFLWLILTHILPQLSEGFSSLLWPILTHILPQLSEGYSSFLWLILTRILPFISSPSSPGAPSLQIYICIIVYIL